MPDARPILAPWRTLVRDALERLGGSASLAELYAALASHPRTQTNPHWKAKIRQCVQVDPLIERAGPGVWRLKP